MKKIMMGIILLLCIFLICGCQDENDNENSLSKKEVHEHCVRAGVIDDGEVSLQYDLYYKGEVLNRLVSEEEVTSSNSSTLDTYENAYREIHKRYDSLKYFEAKVVREEDSVTSKVVIHYDKVNMDQLLSIEGEKDNIIENGVAKVNKWKELAKKFGTSCTVVED